MAKRSRGRIILVAVDFSPVSDDVMSYASELAERLEKHLVILHVVHDPGEAPGYYHVKGHDKVLRRIEDVAREMFDKFLARTRKRHPDNRRLGRSKTLLLTGPSRDEDPRSRHPASTVDGGDGEQGKDGDGPRAARLEGGADRAPVPRAGGGGQESPAGVKRCVL